MLNIKRSDFNDVQKECTDKALNRQLPVVLCISTYPPRQCGIATFTDDLVRALNNKFSQAFKVRVCPLIAVTGEGREKGQEYPFIDLGDPLTFLKLDEYIKSSPRIAMVLIQHEFGLVRERESGFMKFLTQLHVPFIITFHTVLPNPNAQLRKQVKKISVFAKCILVMTNRSAEILSRDYNIKDNKIVVIPHGTHLVLHKDKKVLKNKYGVQGRKVLSTFGLLGPGKSIATTIHALPEIVATHPNVLFLIIDRTHPGLVKENGERYREELKSNIKELGLEKNVLFINEFLELPVLLDYLQLTDIYLFTSKDRNQAVSGTFSYAVSCGCPIISTPIPHAVEVLKENMGILVDFENPGQLCDAVLRLLDDDVLRNAIRKNEIMATAPTSWQNIAIAHAVLFKKLGKGTIKLRYNLPELNLRHIKKLTTRFGMVQFCDINTPDLNSGYTLDDNARALVALGEYYRLTEDHGSLEYIEIYFDFVAYCFQNNASSLNYVDENKEFTEQNKEVNLEDSIGRAIWALGYFISIQEKLPVSFSKRIEQAENMLEASKLNLGNIYSSRAMAFIIKGLYFHYQQSGAASSKDIIIKLADRLVQMYRHEARGKWNWFEGYLTYGNSILPEALICAWEITGKDIYKTIGANAFDFLLSEIMPGSSIRVISNRGWLQRDVMVEDKSPGGEQPIDVAYTIMALARFHAYFPDKGYFRKLKGAFNWFLGDNHLNQIIYNPCTGGCYDGLETHNVNLNQGAESTLSYLISRLIFEKEKSQATAAISKTLEEGSLK